MPAGSTDEADAKNKALPRFLAILDVQEAELQRAIANNLRAMQELRKPRAGRKAAGGEAPAAAAAGDSGASENLPVKATAEAASEAAVPPPSDALMEQLKALHQGLPQARRNTLYRCGAVAGAIAESGLRRMAQTARGLLTQHVHPSRWVSEEGGGDSVDVVDGFLELPQVQGRLARALLVSERCFILDGIVQVFIWVGRLSPPEHRIAARKLALVSQAFQTAWRMPSGGCSRRPLHGGTRVGRRGGGACSTCTSSYHGQHGPRCRGCWSTQRRSNSSASLTTGRRLCRCGVVLLWGGWVLNACVLKLRWWLFWPAGRAQVDYSARKGEVARTALNHVGVRGRRGSAWTALLTAGNTAPRRLHARRATGHSGACGQRNDQAGRRRAGHLQIRRAARERRRRAQVHCAVERQAGGHERTGGRGAEGSGGRGSSAWSLTDPAAP